MFWGCLRCLAEKVLVLFFYIIFLPATLILPPLPPILLSPQPRLSPLLFLLAPANAVLLPLPLPPPPPPFPPLLAPALTPPGMMIKDDDLLLSLKCNERLRPSWQYVARKMQRPLSQVQARWIDLNLQRVATS